jgi:Tfp pilus assembly protein PilN
MIRINLLPTELRRGNRLPPRVLIAAFAAALVMTAAIGWFSVVYFGDLANAEKQLQKVSADLDSRVGKVQYHDSLDANQKDYAKRVQTIQDIGKSRRVWTKFLDDLIDVVNNNGAVDRHLAWFEGITVRGDAKDGFTVDIPGNVQGADKSRLANFHEDLEAAPFAVDLKTKSDVEFRLEMDEERIPPAYLRFPMQLQFKPTVGKK